jgi:hypothetical protein
LYYHQFYKEGATPQSGIDTISIWIHPFIINEFNAFHRQGNNNESLSLRFKEETDYRTGTPIRQNFLLDIQAEALDLNHDILEQILGFLVELAVSGVLKYSSSNGDMGIRTYYAANFSELFAIDALDFYFDFYESDIALHGTNPRYPNTRYNSGSTVNPSVLKAYNRVERLRQKRHVPYEAIENMSYTMRIEFMLKRGNCEYLHCQNLSGSYEEIFYRYLPFLARKWRSYRYEVVDIPNLRNLDYAPHFQQVVYMARSRIPQYQFLCKTPRKPIPFKHAKANETDRNWPAEHYARRTREPEIPG